MIFHTMNDDELITAFEGCAIRPDDWHHREHVRVAWVFLCRHSFDEAVERVRSGIQRLNAANQVPESLTSGYHETLTVAFMHVIASTIRHCGAEIDSRTFVDKHPHLQRSVLRLYYTRERMLTPQAKQSFVTPDIAPLPSA